MDSTDSNKKGCTTLTLTPTREGKRFLLVTLLIAMAAFNTGNNLIYLILAMMLSIFSVSVIVLGINLGGLDLRVSVLQPVFAKQAARLNIFITNAKKFVPSYSLKIHPPHGGSYDPFLKGVYDGVSTSEPRGGVAPGQGYIAYVPASSEASGSATVFFKSRGVYRYGDFTVESGFPFIFFRQKFRSRIKGEIKVYPEIKEIEKVFEFSSTHDGAYTTRTGLGDELLMIRDFRYGDGMKLVHWKASAKAEKLMVKEFAEQEPGKVSIILDDTRPFDADAFEKAVSFAASIARRLIEDGFLVGLVTSGDRLSFGSGPEQLFKILDILAVIKESDTSQLPQPEESRSILILKSGDSPLKRLAPASDMVVYASAL